MGKWHHGVERHVSGVAAWGWHLSGPGKVAQSSLWVEWHWGSLAACECQSRQSWAGEYHVPPRRRGLPESAGLLLRSRRRVVWMRVVAMLTCQSGEGTIGHVWGSACAGCGCLEGTQQRARTTILPLSGETSVRGWRGRRAMCREACGRGGRQAMT